MGYLSPTFIIGVVVLFYLFSFVFFAILRIATGISIQRIGYFSLRRIAYTPREGVKIDLRGLGLHLHRPTFVQPTWVSLRLTELKVTIDPRVTGTDGKARQSAAEEFETLEGPSCVIDASTKSPHAVRKRSGPSLPRSRTWKRLTHLKEWIKHLHEKIHWLRMIDVVVLNSSCVVTDVGCVEIGMFTMAVDMRRQTVDRSRLFQHKKVAAGEQRPAEWMFVVKSVLFTPEGKEALEILDVCGLNIHGLLYKDLAGLRDASVSLKLGRIHVPYDEIVICEGRIRHCRGIYGSNNAKARDKDISMTDVMEELDSPGSREEEIVQTVSDSKEFISSILRGIQEIQVAVTFLGMTKEIRSIRPTGSPLYVNVAMNEFGIDLYRLDPKSPAHRMYFSRKDIAHQALLAGISMAVSVDDGKGEPERILYIPMATTTVKTTLPSRTVANSEDNNVAERNANMLFANLVVTSPSIDLDLKHMPIVFALLRSRSALSKPSPANTHQHRLISRLLPKANIKFSVHEPVIRVALPPAQLDLKGTDEYDLLISSISSISLDVDSSHSSVGDLHYALSSTLRATSHQLYYQTAASDRHNLLMSDAMELKIHVSASPEVRVTAAATLQTFSIHMVRSEISTGVQQIVRHLNNDIDNEIAAPKTTSKDPNYLRRLPPWLTHVHVQGSEFGIELAGIDLDISQDPRGLALQLESWSAEYQLQRSAPVDQRSQKHRSTTSSTNSDESSSKDKSTPRQPKTSVSGTDGRRLAIHVRGLEGYIVEGIDVWESEPFLSMPRFEVAFSTSNDSRGPVLHLHSHIKALYLHYSLYRSYALGVASMELRKAFIPSSHLVRISATKANENGQIRPPSAELVDDSQDAFFPELFTIDVKASFIQAKATMPNDPPMMLQIFNMDAGRHRWAAPFIKSRLTRLYAAAPRVRAAWARVFSTKNARVDLRESRKKNGKFYVDEKSIDVSSDFMRFAVPHQLVPHNIFDNLTNVAKATEQLHYRFVTGTNEYILNKGPEEPKKVPRVSIRTKALMFELEDGPFDWKLGSIYRVGLLEQKQRLAREEAFRVKTKRLAETHHKQASSRHRTQSAPHPKNRGRSKRSEYSEPRGRSRSTEVPSRQRSSSRSDRRGRQMRYDPEGICGLSGPAKISAEEAWLRLQEHNARSWKKRINTVLRYQNTAMREIRAMFWGNDELPEDVDGTENVIAMPERPGLMTTLISDLHVVIDKPSFPLKDYPLFLNKAGKGMPLNMEYSLLIPMSLQIDMGEARVTLRDYPLPLLHVPAIKPGQSPRLASWSLKTDFVIAEEYRGSESAKTARVEVIPSQKITGPVVRGGFAIAVRRTIAPVKTYSDVQISINTSYPTSITWGTSYQPAIQDMMIIIEGFTKPHIDPSDRVGFWDKIRLSVHSRVNVAWKGDGDVLLKLKGSRDPYVVTGHGAGFVMCWRNNVRWDIHLDDDPRRFMTVSSGEYVMAIPDYSHYARKSPVGPSKDNDSLSSTSSQKNNAMFMKVVMKLSGNVRWLAGLVFERELNEGGRSFDFIPHYDVTLKNPNYAKSFDGQQYDAFRGFRSHHIHLSIAVVAPLDRDWSVTNLTPSTSYNTVHLTPRFFTHFFNWWSLFSGVMSLPIRQGKLFPGVEKSSKKFGRHLATIKYNLLLSPLFLAHMYKHKDAEDYSEETVSATGLKLRLDSFMLDLHQRREEFATLMKGPIKQMKTSGMRINQVQLDFISADIRAVSASIVGTSTDDVKHATDEELASYQQSSASSVDISRFTIPDNDFLWIDMDDFVELDWILPAESNPETKIMPLAFAPRFTYFRQTDHEESVHGDATRSSPFGNEPTHYCIMSQDNDPRRVQRDLIRARILVIDEQMEMHQRILGEQELRVGRDVVKDASVKDHYDMLMKQGKLLEEKKLFLQHMLSRLSDLLERQVSWKTSDGDTAAQDMFYIESSESAADAEVRRVEAARLADFVSDFNNRFIVHNVQLKWNNSLRNIILRYVHQVSQRRGFVYYMSRRAVKFILDIVEEQNKAKNKRAERSQAATPSAQPSPTSSYGDEENSGNVEDRIRQLLNDAKRFVDADDPVQSETTQRPTTANLGEDISEEFTPQNSYHVRLIAPQIQLQSEKNAKSVLLVTAKGMQLKVIQIMDKNRLADDVSGLVQRRFSLDMEGVQFFVANEKTLTQFLHLYSANRYGTPRGSTWPPWVPFEVNFDFQLNPFGFHRVVQKTSANLRYDKYNTLRLKYNDAVSKGEPGHNPRPEDVERRIDHIWVEFPQVRAICDSSQYYAMFLIVQDLLLYSEPLEKVRSERLEKIMLASDFSDLRGAPEMVISLQERIRQLEEIRGHFQIHSKNLDRQGWLDRLSIEKDLTNCEDELFFMMKAITTSQRKNDERAQTAQSNGILQMELSTSEIVWHLMRDKNDPLIEVQLNNAIYNRTDNSDGSNHNTMEISRIHGLNLLPDALYPEMLAPYFENSKQAVETKELKMFQVQWYMLEAIAGIPVLDQFEVNLFPLKVQLDREVGKKIFEYIFPGDGPEGSLNPGPSPFLVKHTQLTQQEDEDTDTEGQLTMASTLNMNGYENGDSPNSGARAGSLELRLKPTLALEDSYGQKPSSKSRISSSLHPNSESHNSSFFRHPNRSQTTRTTVKKRSGESLRSAPRTSANTSSSNLSGLTSNTEKSKRFGIHRTASRDSNVEKKQPSDDLTQMMSRASNYMTLAYVRIPSVVLCLSYKGRGERNIEDVHDFVFRMPVLEYRNKTWSNLDLALRLKKDVIKALISHTGAIIGNKFSHHRPNKQQQSRLRQTVISASRIPNAESIANSPTLSEDSSVYERTARDSRSDFVRHSSSPLLRTPSFASSIPSDASPVDATFTTEPDIIPECEAEEDINSRPFKQNSFARRMTTEGQRFWQRESSRERNATRYEDKMDKSLRKESTISLGRLTQEMQLFKTRDSTAPDQDERSRAQSVIHLGKKLLGSLN